MPEKTNQVKEVESEMRMTERKLLALRQHNSASEYASQFRAIASVLNWDDATLMTHFFRGLKQGPKDYLCIQDRPDTLERYMDMTVAFDNRQHAHRSGKRSGIPQGERRRPSPPRTTSP